MNINHVPVYTRMNSLEGQELMQSPVSAGTLFPATSLPLGQAFR